MKKPFHFHALLFLGLLPLTFLFSQNATPCRDVLASAGGYAFAGGRNFEFTLGETVIESIENSAIVLTQGFHQPETCPLVMVGITAIEEASGLTVFPNPTVDELTLQFSAPAGKTFQIQIFNAGGQLVRSLPRSDDANTLIVDCRAFPAGSYFLVAHTVEGALFFKVSFVKAGRL